MWNNLGWSQDVWNNIWSMIGAIIGIFGAYGIANWQMKKEKLYEDESLLYKLLHDYLLMQFDNNTQELIQLKEERQFESMRTIIDKELTVYFDILQQIKKSSKSFQFIHQENLNSMKEINTDIFINMSVFYSVNGGVGETASELLDQRSKMQENLNILFNDLKQQ